MKKNEKNKKNIKIIWILIKKLVSLHCEIKIKETSIKIKVLVIYFKVITF